MELVVPARNEAARLPGSLMALRAWTATHGHVGGVRVVVVDNGSTDGTADVAASFDSAALPVTVVSEPRPGKGAAVRAGMAATSADVVGYLDADGATDLSALGRALWLLGEGHDVALGSRAVAGSSTSERHSAVRAWGAALYRRCTWTVAPGIHDTQCGFKLFDGDLARDVFARSRCDGFSFDVEILRLSQLAGGRIAEFPVRWVDVPGSRFRPAVHGLPAFWELALIHRRLRGIPVAAVLRPDDRTGGAAAVEARPAGA